MTFCFIFTGRNGQNVILHFYVVNMVPFTDFRWQGWHAQAGPNVVLNLRRPKRVKCNITFTFFYHPPLNPLKGGVMMQRYILTCLKLRFWKNRKNGKSANTPASSSTFLRVKRKNVTLHFYVILNPRRQRRYVTFYGPKANRIDQTPSPIDSSQTVNPENVNKRGEISYLCKFTTSHVPAASQITCSSPVLGAYMSQICHPFWIICVGVFFPGGQVLNM